MATLPLDIDQLWVDFLGGDLGRQNQALELARLFHQRRLVQKMAMVRPLGRWPWKIRLAILRNSSSLDNLFFTQGVHAILAKMMAHGASESAVIQITNLVTLLPTEDEIARDFFRLLPTLVSDESGLGRLALIRHRHRIYGGERSALVPGGGDWASAFTEEFLRDEQVSLSGLMPALRSFDDDTQQSVLQRFWHLRGPQYFESHPGEALTLLHSTADREQLTSLNYAEFFRSVKLKSGLIGLENAPSFQQPAVKDLFDRACAWFLDSSLGPSSYQSGKDYWLDTDRFLEVSLVRPTFADFAPPWLGTFAPSLCNGYQKYFSYLNLELGNYGRATVQAKEVCENNPIDRVAQKLLLLASNRLEPGTSRYEHRLHGGPLYLSRLWRNSTRYSLEKTNKSDFLSGNSNFREAGSSPLVLEPDKSLLIVPLSGISDELRLARTYGFLSQSFRSVSVIVDPRLHGVLSSTHTSIRFIPHQRQYKGSPLDRKNSTLDVFSPQDLRRYTPSDFHLDSDSYDLVTTTNELSQMLINGELYEPQQPVYLARAPGAEQNLSTRLIGVTWSSHVAGKLRRINYLDWTDFRVLLDRFPGVRFVAMQTLIPPEDKDNVRAAGFETPDGDFLNDVDSLWTQCSQLFAHVGVSSLPSEMSAALGVPTFFAGFSPESTLARRSVDGSTRDRLTGGQSRLVGPDTSELGENRRYLIDKAVGMIGDELEILFEAEPHQ